jgi:prepilin-type N-terminal cleavage/methylation domain-containing protein
MRKGFTLVELIISISLLAFIVAGYWTATLAIDRRMRVETDEAQLRMQLYNALDNVRLHCISASKIDPRSLFPAGQDSHKDAFFFRGQKDVYKVTPSDLRDDTWYLYAKDQQGNIVLREVSDTGGVLAEDLLVEARYAPELTFSYRAGAEPNFLEITLSGTIERNGKRETVYQKIGVRFWFVEVLAV